MSAVWKDILEVGVKAVSWVVCWVDMKDPCKAA